MSDPDTSYQDVRAGSAAIAVDFHSQSESLVVAFGGMAHTRDMPIFEFFHTASHMDTNAIFVRDLRHAWYHRGLPGIARNIDGIAAHLDGLIKSKPFKQVTFVGSSTGGYAAILFGFLLHADTVIAFVPKTFLSPWMRLLRFDVKTWAQMGALIWSRTAQKEYFDLRRVLQSRPADTEFHVHYSANARVDILHAERLRGVPNVHLHEHRDGGHKLVRKLRDTGKLKEILLQSLNTKPSAQTGDPP
jgi:pimeloyl-ACP methyl ester carboxylesterase